MSKQTASDIRKSFIEFFKNKQHDFVPSSSLVPKDDPTLLFINAGMNQFKPIFLGNNPRNFKRVVNSQKCLRVSGKHNDLDEVGKDGHHHTFFEMLGNWSFNDYGKKEAITWSWELLTKVWKLPEERLFVTVYPDDDEAYKIWKDNVGISEHRIRKFEKENFWEMGSTGPCGPSSEIMFDTGNLDTQDQTFKDPKEGINGENERYIEIWNLVFIQFERLADQSLKKLPQLHIDTGSGLERVCAVIQGCNSNYETDIFKPIITAIVKETGNNYNIDERGLPHRVIADHIRAICFTIADGITPGNEGRGYVVRRILRRASRFSHKLGVNEPLLYKLVKVLSSHMGDFFPEIKEQEAYITQVIKAEEQQFLKTMFQGLNKLETIFKDLENSKTIKINGADAFLLHDTYGFPVDLTQIISQERGFEVDLVEYKKQMEQQRQRARAAAKFDNKLGNDESWIIINKSRETKFLGYETLTLKSSVTRYKIDGKKILICLDKSPFYAESGGQIGDIGVISNEEIKLKVNDTTKAFGLHIHTCTLIQGEISQEKLQNLETSVNTKARLLTARHHSVTHLLHSALRKVLGAKVNQKGSWVGPERLRFDFTFHQKIEDEKLEEIEDLVNSEIQKNSVITTKTMSLEEAKRDGAVALFGEAYQEPVRVLSMGSFSKELCGGTHAKSTGEIGLFCITSESSIAAGIRRIEALASSAAFNYLRKKRKTINDIADSLKTSSEKILDKIDELKKKKNSLEKEAKSLKDKHRKGFILKLMLSQDKTVSGYDFICSDIKEIASEDLKSFSQDLLSVLNNQEIVVIAKALENRTNLMFFSGPNAQKTLKAKDLAKKTLDKFSGKGGGKADFAQGAVSKQVSISEIFSYVKELME